MRLCTWINHRAHEKTSTAVDLKNRRWPCTWKTVDGSRRSCSWYYDQSNFRQFEYVTRVTAATFTWSAPMIYHRCPNLPDLAGAPALIFNRVTLIFYLPFLAMTSSRVPVFWWGHLLSTHHGLCNRYHLTCGWHNSYQSGVVTITVKLVFHYREKLRNYLTILHTNRYAIL